MKVAGSRKRWSVHVQRMGEDILSKELGKQKRVAEEEEEDQRCYGKTVSNEILKGQVRMAKSRRPPQKTEGDGKY